jgi:ribonuclease Z
MLTINSDAIPGVIQQNLQGLSWPFSHFILWRGARLLLDCGEGTAMCLERHVFRAETVALSHGHFDHCRGLLGLLEVRSGLKGATEKPLRIVYPEGSPMMGPCIDEARQFVEKHQMGHIHFEPMGSGQSLELRKGYKLEARLVTHVPRERSLAYRVGKLRRRLSPEHRSLSKSEIAEIVRQGRRDSVQEEFFDCELAYSGDTDEFDPEFCRGANVLIHEGTFLNEADRNEDLEGRHSSIEGALRCAATANVRHLLLFHVARRYEADELVQGIRRLIDQIGLESSVTVLRGGYHLPTV